MVLLFKKKKRKCRRFNNHTKNSAHRPAGRMYRVEVEADGNATPYMFLEIDDSRCVFTVHVFETEDYNNSEYHDKLIFYPHDFLDDSLLLEIVNNGSKYIYYKSEAIVSNNIDNEFMLTIKDKVNIMLLRFYTHKEEIRDYEKKLKDYNSLMDSLKNK